MKSILRTLLLSAVVCCGLSGCVLTLLMMGPSNISKDKRFEHVVGREVRTRQTLRLFIPSEAREADMRHLYDLTDMKGGGTEGLAARVPAGTPVRFNKAVRQNGLGDSAEYLYGEMTLKGQTYPLYYYLGTSVYPDGWRRMYDAFVIKE